MHNRIFILQNGITTIIGIFSDNLLLKIRDKNVIFYRPIERQYSANDPACCTAKYTLFS